MARPIVICTIALLLLASCGRNPQLPMVVVADKSAPNESVLVTGSLVRPGPKLAYTHEIAIEMSDDKVAPRFERARTSCLEDQALNCSLMVASITVGDATTGVRPNARLSVRLPHMSVQKFETSLLAPLPGEGEGQPSLRQSSTSAEDLTEQLTDVGRRLAQQNDFRDRLNLLSKRADAKVDDLIKVEQQIAEVQSEIEGLTAQNRNLNTRVDTEVLNIELRPYASLVSVSSPLGEAWNNARHALGESAAGVLTFIVVLLPWLPLIALGWYVLSLLWRRMRAARQARMSKT